MLYVVEHGVDACHRRDADRTWRKTRILIRIIRTLDIQQVVVDALQAKLLPGELNGWVCLQRHSFWIFGVAQHQSVVIHAGNHRFLGVVGGLFVHDARQGDYLYWGELHRLRLLGALKVPELVALFLHSIQQFADGNVPIDVVGVRDEHAGDGGCVVAILLTGGLVGERLADFQAVEHKFLAEFGREFVDGAYGRDGEVDGFLESVFQMSPHLEGSVAGMDGVAACANVVCVARMMGERTERLHRDALGEGLHLIIYRVDIIVGVDIHILGFAAFRERREAVEITYAGNRRHAADGPIEIQLRN